MKFSKIKSLKLSTLETVIFSVIWILIFSIPVFQQQNNESFFWNKITNEWIRMSALLVIFVINIHVFVPRFLFQKKYAQYILYTFLLIIISISLVIYLKSILFESEPVSMPPMNFGPGMPPMEFGKNMPPPIGYKPPQEVVKQSVTMIFVNNFILSILVVGASIAFKMMTQWLYEENRRKELEKEQLKTEIALLRHQVSPHFFMNTLNNIHALVDINTETAKNAIIRLSTLMRYLLYETAQGHTTLKKELDFIESYISLMKLRFSEKVIIQTELPENIPDVSIPPMLFNSFIENAFKHGVSYQSASYVYFKVEILDNQLNCLIKNSKHKPTELPNKKFSGIGMDNIRKSLDLLFEDKYKLDIQENEKEYRVQLTFPL